MTDAPDLEKLARRYLDLWQEQTAALANDPVLAENIGQAYSAMTKGATAFANAVGLSVGKSAAEAHDTTKDVPPKTPGSSRSAAPAASSDDPALGVDRLLRRIATLEKRVLHLEAALGRRGGRTRAANRQGRPRGFSPGG